MNMIEKVARALAAIQETEDQWEYYITSARVAIKAMREPSDEMLNEGFRGAWKNEDGGASFYVKPCWIYMIDEALRE